MQIPGEIFFSCKNAFESFFCSNPVIALLRQSPLVVWIICLSNVRVSKSPLLLLIAKHPNGVLVKGSMTNGPWIIYGGQILFRFERNIAQTQLRRLLCWRGQRLFYLVRWKGLYHIFHLSNHQRHK